MFYEKLLFDLLGGLGVKEKEALLLRYFEGLGVSQVAEIMNTTEGMARVYLYRGEVKLRNLAKSDPRCKDYLNGKREKRRKEGKQMEDEIPRLKIGDHEYRCVGAIVSHFLEHGAYSEITVEMVEKAGFLRERVERVLKILEAQGLIDNKDGKCPALYKATKKLKGRETKEVWKELISLGQDNGPVVTLQEERRQVNGAEESVAVQTRNGNLDKKGDAMNHLGRKENSFDKIREAVEKLIDGGKRTTVNEVMKATGLSQPCVGSHMRTMAEQNLIKRDKSTHPHIWTAVAKSTASDASVRGDGHDFKGDDKAGVASRDEASDSDADSFVSALGLIEEGLSRLKEAAVLYQKAAALSCEGQSLIIEGSKQLKNRALWFSGVIRIIKGLKDLEASELS